MLYDYNNKDYMVKNFPLDGMHLLYEGIMSKLIDTLRFGDYKLSSANLFECDNFLRSIRLFIPSEFSRLPRSINHSHLWKATEFRLFSLYLIPIFICKGLLNDTNLCKLFMNFHVISYILNSKFLLAKHYLYVESLALAFIQQCEFLFGPKFVVYNVHCLKHIIEHCKLLGTVESFSAFKFENFMRYIKKTVRSPHNPLSQAVNRIAESNPCLGHLKPQIVNCAKKSIFLRSLNCKISSKTQDSCIINMNTDIFVVIELIGSFVRCRKFNVIENLFVN